MSEDGVRRGEPSLLKTEVPPLIPSKPPDLLPLPSREDLTSSRGEADKQVQAAMAMAAFYSQSPLWQAAVAARDAQVVRLQQHATVPHPAVAALHQLPGRTPQTLAGFNFHSLAGLASLSSGSGLGLGGFTGQASLEQSRQDMYRDYLNKLAHSTLSITTSGGSAHPTYLQSPPSASEKREKSSHSSSRRRSSSPAVGDVSSSKRRSSPLSLNPFLAANASYFNMPPCHTSPEEKGAKTPNSRSPPSSGRGRNNSTSNRDKVFTCNICNRSFGYKHVLQNHERTHTGEKPFECRECHKRFTRDHHLKTHMRLHTGEKPYSCTHCDRQFVQVANLRRHLRVHTGERPYKCELCPSNFSDSNQLKAHILIHKGQSLSSLKEELLFRHSLAGGGFPLPQYPPPPLIQDQEADRTSLSPASKDTGSGDSPSHGENMSDSNSEKKRARKQKPRRIAPQWGEGESPGEYQDRRSYSTKGVRQRHSSEFSHGQPMQQEAEDLTMKPRLEALKEYHRKKMSEYSFSNYRRESLEEGRQLVKAEDDFSAEYGKKNRSEGERSEGSSHSPHSTLRDKYRLDEADDEEEEDRGVSPPLSHPTLYNPIFSGPAAIQLGLAGASMPLSSLSQRFNGDKEADRLALVTQTEISQQ